MKMKIAVALVASLLLVTTSPSRSADSASANDTARFIAGLQPSAESPLTPLADKSWQQHASQLNAAFDKVEKQQLSKIRTWTSETLTSNRPTMLYFFSGPDFLYANAFFPKATTYVLAALEPVGEIPDLMKLPRGSVVPALGPLRHSMNTILAVSFFITKNMQTELRSGKLTGALPVLYVFLARSGKTISDVSLVNLDANGELRMGDGVKEKSLARGAKIVFAGSDGRTQTLYYFSTDISNGGFNKTGFAKFAETLGPADSFIKSASYLLHGNNFSQARDFLIERSALILEDDSGIPFAHFDQKKWVVRPFGRYIGPLGIFPGTNQPKLRDLYQKGSTAQIPFGVGYRWRPTETNLLLAIKDPDAASKQEAPKQEAPKQEAPKQDAPKQKASKQKTPKRESPKQ